MSHKEASLKPDNEGSVEEQVRAAVLTYEKALVGNDVAELDRLFADGPDTLRADVNGVLVGADQIREFRRSRTAIPMRDVTAVHVVVHSSTVATAIAETLRPDGGRGLQTQVWQLSEDGWKVRAAHLSNAPSPRSTRLEPVADCATWRVTGTPLVPATTPGDLDGVGMAVKDLFAVAGYATGAGNPAYLLESHPATRHAHVVDQMLRAGAEIVGIAQTDEFAFSLSGTNVHYGSPPNPWSPAVVVGGSSSGVASAVARDLADVGLATDTAGSIRVPSSYCGLFGLRTSTGALSTDGVLALSPSFDAVGWMTKSAELLDRVARVMLPPSRPVTRIVVADDLMALADPALGDLVSRHAQTLSTLCDLEIEHAEVSEDETGAWLAAFQTIQRAEAWALRGDWIQRHPGVLGPGVASRFALGAEIDDAALEAARGFIQQVRARLRHLVPAGTALVAPAASSTAPPLRSEERRKQEWRMATLQIACAAGIGGLPVAVVPAGVLDGLPVGMALIGSAGHDTALTGLAANAAAAHG